MKERITSRILLKNRIPTYKERADYYRRRAVIKSLQVGVLDFLDDKVEGVELVDPIDTVAIAIPGQQQGLEFAFGQDGVAFARIEGNKYYPINLEPSKDLLKTASDYDRCTESFLKRLFYFGGERMDSAFFGLQVAVDDIDDAVTALLILFHEKLQQKSEITEQIKNISASKSG